MQLNLPALSLGNTTKNIINCDCKMSSSAEKVDNEKTYIKNVSYSAAHVLNS